MRSIEWLDIMEWRIVCEAGAYESVYCTELGSHVLTATSRQPTADNLQVRAVIMDVITNQTTCSSCRRRLVECTTHM